MKQIKLILTMLLVVLLPTEVLAQTKTVTSTFNGIEGPYQMEVGPKYVGYLNSAEGNTWFFSCERQQPEKKTVNGKFAMSLSGDPIRLKSQFEMIGYVKRITVRAGGSVSKIKAGISITKDEWEFSSIDLGTLTATTTDVKDYEIVVDESIAKDAFVYADEKYFEEGFHYGDYIGTISVEITPKSTNGATIIESVTVELAPNLPGDDMSGTCGENLTWSVSKVSPQILFISGTGKMDDYSGSAPWTGFTGISKVVIDEGVTSVGSLAFLGLDKLSSAKLPSTLELISGMAFYRCPITSIDLPEGLQKVDYDAFCSTKLESVTLPSTVKSLGTRAFSQCPLKSIVVKEGNEVFESPDNCNAIITKDSKRLVQGCDYTVIPDGVRYIDYMAFYRCSGLTSITIPGTLEVIETLGLGGCSGLKTLVIPDNVTTLKSSAIADCTGLETLTIGSGVTIIDENAFKNTTRLAKVHCYADPAALTWTGFDNANNFMADKATVIHVRAADLQTWQTKFADINATFVGDLDGVSLNKSEAILEKGKTMTLKATVTPESLADKSVKWKSSNTAVATVSSSGKVKGVKAGTATITCTSVATGAKATCQVTVSYVKLDQSEAILEKGKTMKLTSTVYPSKSTDQSVTWKSSNTAVATVTSSGKVKGVKAGTATITCTSVATGLSTTCQVTVSYVKLDQTEAILEKGKTMTLAPTVYPSKQTDQSVTWESSNTAVATVTSDGKVKGVKAGIVTITCTSVATGLSTTCKVTVSYVKLDQSKAILEKGKTMTLAPTVYPSKQTDQSVTWESSNTAVATVTSDGKVKGVKAGTATITCTSVATGLSTTCQVTVSYVKLDQSKAILEKGKTMTLASTVYPSKQTDQSVKWKSSNTTVATVTSSGKVKGVKAGTATITCTSVATGLSTTCQVTVSYVKLDKSEAILEKGETITLTSTVYPSKSTDQSVTWKSSDKTVATVSSSGKVKGVKAGTATITCTSVATGLSTTCKVTVTESSGARTLDEDDADLTDIEALDENPAVEEPFDVYDLRGRKVMQRVTSLDGLPAGVYIVNGKKVLKK